MEPEAQSESAPAEVAQETHVQEVDQVEQVTESFNIFTEESAPSSPPEGAEARGEEPRKSKQFLEKVRQDKEARRQDIAIKQREAELRAKEESVHAMIQSQRLLKENPEEFLRSQGIDPVDYYHRWTEKMISPDGDVSIDTKVSDTKKELEALKRYMAQKNQAEQQAQASSQQQAAYGGLIGEVEHFASSNEGYETIKGTCTAKDIVNGMISHFKNTGEEITIEEAFDKIETGLREREESFYKDPKIIEKLRRYNPEAMRTARGPQATLSARFKEQPTRTDPDDMSFEEIREHWKGKLFT